MNEVKKIEIELDRTGAQCRDLNDKVAYEETQCKVITVSLIHDDKTSPFFRSVMNRNHQSIGNEAVCHQWISNSIGRC